MKKNGEEENRFSEISGYILYIIMIEAYTQIQIIIKQASEVFRCLLFASCC